MKMLAFADVHGSKKMLERLIRIAKKEKVDALICAGDLSIFERELQIMLRMLASSKLPVFIINGNHETVGILHYLVGKHNSAKKTMKFVHKKVYDMNGILLFGYGGGGFSMTDSEFEKTAKKYSRVLKRRDFVLITHAPPYKTKLDKLGSSYHGNKSIANFIKFHKPLLAVSGHLHETAGKKDRIGNTIIINPGPKGMIVEL